MEGTFDKAGARTYLDYVKKYVESTLGPDLNYELDFIKVCALA